MAIMTLQPDGSMVREVRAPRPGETDFVVCHCQEKQAATQDGWYVPTFVPVVLESAPILDVPTLVLGWDQPEPRSGSSDGPPSQITHPPSV